MYAAGVKGREKGIKQVKLEKTTYTSNSISRVNCEPESHPSPSQTESLVSCIPFKLQTMRFCVSQVVHMMVSGKNRRSSWIFGLDLLVCFRFDLFRFACDLRVPLLFACG